MTQKGFSVLLTRKLKGFVFIAVNIRFLIFQLLFEKCGGKIISLDLASIILIKSNDLMLLG